MDVFLTVLHVMVCTVLILVVLLQRGKGADMGAMLGGGGANTVFGSRGAGNFLTKTTAACAAIFMITSMTLSYMTNLGGDTLDLDDEIVTETAPTGGDSDLLEEIPSATSEPGASSGLEEIPSPAATEPGNE